MVQHATEQPDTEKPTSPHTRAVPAFKVIVKAGHAAATEGTEPGGHFPDGINFDAVKPIDATVSQSLDDHLSVLELLDDE